MITCISKKLFIVTRKICVVITIIYLKYGTINKRHNSLRYSKKNYIKYLHELKKLYEDYYYFEIFILIIT